jgi:hypothetical protein
MPTALSGQVTVTTAETAEQFGSSEHAGKYVLMADPANTGTYMYFGNDGNGDVSSTTGLPIKKGDPPVVARFSPKDMWVDTDNSGDKLCWLRIF